MSKITLTPISNPSNLTSLQNTINANNTVIQTAWDNTLSRDGTTPNQMTSNLDMNSNQILNLPSPATANSPARLIDVVSNPTITVPPVGTSGAVVGLLSTGKTDSGNNTWTGTNTFNNTATFSSIVLPSNSVTGSNIAPNTITSADIAGGAVSNINLANMPGLSVKANNSSLSASPSDLSITAFANMLGFGSNNSTTRTSNYTLQAADNGTTIILGGGLQFTITATAASGYAPNYMVRLVNLDSRGKSITLNGLSTFILWPNQITYVSNVNNNWIYSDPGRWRKVGATFYVDINNGLDSNDGLVPTTGAFRTIGAACSALYSQVDCMNSIPTINVANGTYGESVTLQGQLTGTNVFFIIGASPSGVVWRPASNYCLIVGDNAEVEIQNVKWDNVGGATGANAITVHQTGVLDILSGCEFGNFGGGTHMVLDHGGGSLNLPASYIISGGTQTHIQVGGASCVTMTGGGTVTVNNAPSIGTFMFVAGSGANVSLAGGTTFGTLTGCQKYQVILNGSISLGGNTLPGSVAGTTATGGQVA